MATQVQTPAYRSIEQRTSSLLRYALLADAAVELATGAALLAASGSIADFTGFGAAWMPATGVALILYAAVLLYVANENPIDSRKALVVAFLNIDGAILCALIVMGVIAVPMTQGGWWAALIAVDVFAALGIAQIVGWRRGRK